MLLPTAEAKKRERIKALDILRGAAMVFVIFYHLVYDLKYIYCAEIPKAITPGSPGLELVHNIFLWILFLVSGICTRFSRDAVKRGAVLYIIGWLITLGTSYLMPSELIVFGVLSCFGAVMVIIGLTAPFLSKIPWQGLLAGSLLLWVIFRDFSHGGIIHLFMWELRVPLPLAGDYIYPIGIKSADFYSSDYFPVIPFIFIFLCGFALYTPIKEHKLPEFFYRLSCPPLELPGKYSLIVYALHQPLLLIPLLFI